MPLNRAVHLDGKPLLDRMTKWDEIIGNHGATPQQGTVGEKCDQFKLLLDNFREVIFCMAGPIINTHFAVEFNKKYPDFSFGNGRTVRKIEDFVDWIHGFDPNESGQISLQEARAMVHFSAYPLFGKSNHWAVRGEREILDLLALEYDGNRMSNKQVNKRVTRHGFAKALCVKKADQLRTKIIEAWARCFSENFFARDNYKPKNNDGNQNVPVVDAGGNDGGNDGARKASKKGIPKPDKSDLRKYIVICRHHTHMFDGSYLLLEGHPRRKEIDGEVAMKSKEQEEREQKELIISRFAADLRKRDLGAFFGSEATGKADGNEPLFALLRNAGLMGPVANCDGVPLMSSGKSRYDLLPVEKPTLEAPPAKKQRMSQGVVPEVSDSDDSSSNGSSSPSSFQGNTDPFSEEIAATGADEDDPLLRASFEPLEVREHTCLSNYYP